MDQGGGSATSSDLGRASDVHDDVRGFIRTRAVLPLLIHTVLLVLVLFNLAIARKEEGMVGKVLWSALGFAVLIVGSVVSLYRPSDETPSVVASECRSSAPKHRSRSRVKTGLTESAKNHQVVVNINS